MPGDTIGEMQFWSTFGRYLHWAVEFLWVPPFVYGTIALLVALPLAIWQSWTSIRHNWKPKHWLMFLQFVFFPAELAVAVLGTVPSIPWPRQQPHSWATMFDAGLSWGCLLFGAFCVWRMKGLRAIALLTLLWAQWLMQGAGLIAASALSSIWP